MRPNPTIPSVFFVDFYPDKLLPLPLARFQRGIGIGDVAGEGHHQSDGVLGGSNRIALRGVDHQDPSFGGGSHVDVVHAHPRPTDDFQVRPRLDHLAGDPRAGAHHDGVVVGNDRDQLLRRKVGLHIHLGHLGEDVDPRLIDGIRDDNSGHKRR